MGNWVNWCIFSTRFSIPFCCLAFGQTNYQPHVYGPSVITSPSLTKTSIIPVSIFAFQMQLLRWSPKYIPVLRGGIQLPVKQKQNLSINNSQFHPKSFIIQIALQIYSWLCVIRCKIFSDIRVATREYFGFESTLQRLNWSQLCTNLHFMYIDLHYNNGFFNIDWVINLFGLIYESAMSAKFSKRQTPNT